MMRCLPCGLPDPARFGRFTRLENAPALPKLEPLIYNQLRRLRNCWQPPLQIRTVYDWQKVCGHFSRSVRTNWLALSANPPAAARRALLAPAVLRGVGANRCGSAGPRPASPHVPLVRTNPQHPRAPSPRGAATHSQANVQVNGRCDLKHKRDADLACWRAISVQNRCRGALRCGEGKRRAPPGHAGHRPTARVNGALPSSRPCPSASGKTGRWRRDVRGYASSMAGITCWANRRRLSIGFWPPLLINTWLTPAACNAPSRAMISSAEP